MGATWEGPADVFSSPASLYTSRGDCRLNKERRKDVRMPLMLVWFLFVACVARHLNKYGGEASSGQPAAVQCHAAGGARALV